MTYDEDVARIGKHLRENGPFERSDRLSNVIEGALGYIDRRLDLEDLDGMPLDAMEVQALASLSLSEAMKKGLSLPLAGNAPGSIREALFLMDHPSQVPLSKDEMTIGDHLLGNPGYLLSVSNPGAVRAMIRLTLQKGGWRLPGDPA